MSAKSLDRKRLVTLLAIVLAGLAVAYYAQRLTQWLAYDDEGGYLYAAWRISLGEAPYRDFLTPQLPVFLYPGAAVLALSGCSVYAARLSMIVYTVLAALGAFWAARRLWGDWVALAALVIALVHQEMFWAARFFRPEAPMLFWGLVGLCLLVASYDGRRRLGLAAAGVALALATVSKLFGALMMVGVGLFIVAEGIRTRDWRDMLRTGLWVGLPYVATVALFVAAFSVVSRDFVAAVLGHHLQQGKGTPAPRVIGKALALYWEYVRSQPLLWALALVAALASWRGGPEHHGSERRVFLWQLLTLLAFLGMTRDLQARHCTYVVPSLAVCAAAGLGWLLAAARRLWPWGKGRWLVALPGVALLVAMLAPQMGRNAWVRSWSENTTPEWTHYLQTLTAPGDTIISDYPGLNFFAQRPTTRLAAGISRGAAQSGQIRGVDLIAEIEESQARMVLLNVAQGAHQFSELRDYAAFKAYVQQHYYLIERKQYDYRLMEVYHRDDLWAGERRETLLGHELALTGVQWERAHAAPGEQVWALLRWQSRAAMSADYVVTLRLLDDAGHEWGLGSKALVDIDRDTYWDERGLEQAVQVPTSQWPLHEATIGNYELPIAPGTPPGVYHAVARVHQLGSWAGLPVQEAEAGALVGYDVLLGEVIVDPARAAAADLPEMPEALDLPLGEGLTLLGSSTAALQGRPGDTLEIELLWDVATPHVAASEITIWLEGAQRVTIHRGPLLGPNALAEQVLPGARLRGQYALKLPAEIAAGDYRLTLALAGGAETDIATVQVAGQSRQFVAPPMQHNADLLAAGGLRLLGYDHDSEQVQAGDELLVTLYWRCERPIDVAYTVFVHLQDAEGRLWAQHDGVPASGEAPTTGWIAGQMVVDAHALALPADAPPGEFSIAVGLYDATTGLRAPLHDATAVSLPDDRVIIGDVEVIAR
jgi:hypothetical protein